MARNPRAFRLGRNRLRSAHSPRKWRLKRVKAKLITPVGGGEVEVERAQEH
jgi:hypothetical protein